ncbi:MAG: GNAT family N-acetyltransferase [Stappiaceae bacterium]
MSVRPFNRQPVLTDGALLLRPLERTDFEPLFAAASDPKIWEGHPANNRHEPDVFRRYFDERLKTQSTLIIIEECTQQAIGCSAYYTAPDMPDSISIGFTFLTRKHWGGKTNRQVKDLMIAHALKNFDAVWFHINLSNIRSQKATVKLGAKHVYTGTIDLSGGPTQWMCFKIDRNDWP